MLPFMHDATMRAVPRHPSHPSASRRRIGTAARAALLRVLTLLAAGLLLGQPLQAHASAPGVPRAVRRELNHAEAQLRHEVAHLAPRSGIEIVRENDRVILRVPANLLFPPDGEELRHGAQTAHTLAVPAQLLQRQRRLNAVVAVYTDNIGGGSFNTSFSEHRAEAVVDALKARGVASQRLQAEGAGATETLASNDTPEGRIENRRVEFVFERPPPLSARRGQ